MTGVFHKGGAWGFNGLQGCDHHPGIHADAAKMPEVKPQESAEGSPSSRSSEPQEIGLNSRTLSWDTILLSNYSMP